MEKMEKFCRTIEDKLSEIMEKGLTTGNLEMVYKLTDIYKDLKNTEYWELKSDYYMAVLEEMQGGYSEATEHTGARGGRGGYSQRYEDYSSRRGQRRDSRGRYSRTGRGVSYRDESYSQDGYDDGDSYTRYMDSKQSYRSSKSGDCKERLMETLDEYMEEFTEQMEEMLRDADCAEERETIKRYLSKIKSLG